MDNLSFYLIKNNEIIKNEKQISNKASFFREIKKFENLEFNKDFDLSEKIILDESNKKKKNPKNNETTIESRLVNVTRFEKKLKKNEIIL